MSTWSDLDAIQVPADNAAALATWGAQVASNSTALWGLLAQSWNTWLNGTPAAVSAVGSSQREGYYHHIGKTITGMFSIKFDTATIGTAEWIIGLPRQYVAGGLRPIGTFVLKDASTGKRHGGVVVTDSTSATSTCTLWHEAGAVTNTSPITIADGDVLMVNVFYESTITGGITGGAVSAGFGETGFGEDFGS